MTYSEPPRVVGYIPEPVPVPVPAVIALTGIYNPEDVARIFRCSEKTVERWELPWSRMSDKVRVILGETLLDEVRKRSHGALPGR